MGRSDKRSTFGKLGFALRGVNKLRQQQGEQAEVTVDTGIHSLDV